MSSMLYLMYGDHDIKVFAAEWIYRSQEMKREGIQAMS
jgi:hypothetical protein